MKTMKKLLFLPLLFSMFFLNSCQEEGIVILQDNAEEAILANSVAADLIQRTSARDGSIDNIIDQASCIEIMLPLTVYVNGLEITVNSVEDYEVIEAIFDQLDDDEDSLDIIFPITIILSDYTEIVIQSQDQLENFIENCAGENEDDDDIECIDFVYPITYSVFDTNNNVINTVTINNDEDMYHFIHEIDENDIIALNFPVTLEFSDGQTITVNNVSELEEALSSAIDYCDEDDDNDYGDDDFSLNELNELLVTCPWVVHAIHRDDNNISETYRNYALQFNEDGTVKARRRNGEIVEGTWSTEISANHGVQLTLNFPTLDDFTLVWSVSELEDDKIELHTEGGNRIILKKNCHIIFDQTIERIENILKECFWRIDDLEINDVHHEDQYIGTPIKFEDDGVAKLRINGEYVVGTWEIMVSGAGFVLQMNFDGRPNLNLSWLITELEDDKIELENQNSEMELKKVCPDADDDIVFINETLIDGTWSVAYFEEDSVDMTANFNDYILDFIQSRRVNVTGNGQDFGGSWLSFRNEDGQLKLALNFMDHDIFYELNNRWKIIEITASRIELVDYRDDDGYNGPAIIEKKVILEKN